MTYPEKKLRELKESEKELIRVRIRKLNDPSEKIADEFDCSSSQVAGIKSQMTRRVKIISKI